MNASTAAQTENPPSLWTQRLLVALLGALIAGCILAGRSLLSGDVKITAGCTVDRVAGIREWARASNHSNHPVDYTTVFTVVDGSGRPVLSEGGEQLHRSDPGGVDSWGGADNGSTVTVLQQQPGRLTCRAVIHRVAG